MLNVLALEKKERAGATGQVYATCHGRASNEVHFSPSSHFWFSNRNSLPVVTRTMHPSSPPKTIIASFGRCCLHKDGVAIFVSSLQSRGPPKVAVVAHSQASPLVELSLDQVFLTGKNTAGPGATHCVEGLKIQDDMLAVWSLHDVRVYRFYGSTTSPSLVASLTVPKPIAALALHGSVLFMALAGENKVDIYRDLLARRAMKGEAAAESRPCSAVPFSAKEGCPLFLDVRGNVLAVATDRRVLKLFSLDKSGMPQQWSSFGHLSLPEEKEEEKEGDEGVKKGMTLTSIHLNADATRVSFVLSSIPSFSPLPARLCIYDVDRDVAHAVSCLTTAAASPTTHMWDAEDPKFLVCICTTNTFTSPIVNARDTSKKKTETKKKEGNEDAGVVITLLVSPDAAKVTCLETSPLSPPLGDLLGVQAPHFYFISSSPKLSTSNIPPSSLMLKRTMRDFAGLEYDSLTSSAQAALKAFHYHLLTQDWHAAHQALKSVSIQQQRQMQLLQKGRRGREGGDCSSTGHEQQQQQKHLVCVWRNMARLCLQTRCVDVAELCLGHMGHVRGLTAVREAVSTSSLSSSSSSSSSIDVALAMVAIQLGLLKEAAALYTQAKRFDLLNRMFQAAGQWEDALRVAQTEDRFNLRRTHFEYARQLEGAREWEKAIWHYEKAGAQAREVPRMLLKVGKMAELEMYVKKRRGRGEKEEEHEWKGEKEEEDARTALWQWWGKYCESKGDIRGATEAYENASDLVALVRLACVAQDVETAEALLEGETTKGKILPREKHHPLTKLPVSAVNRAASYHLARHYEGALHDILPALAHYARAGCFQHCLRLAMAHELDGDVMHFALQSDSERLMRQSARYFSGRGQEERARELLDKAVEKVKEGNRV